VPEPDDINETIAVIDSVDHTIGAHDDFTEKRVVKFGNHATHFGKFTETFGVADEKLAKTNRAFR